MQLKIINQAYSTHLNIFTLILFTLCFTHSNISSADSELPLCENQIGVFASIEGTVEVQRTSHPAWYLADQKSKLCQNDSIRVGKNSRAAISLINKAILRIKQNTTLHLTNITQKETEKSILEVLKGVIQSFSRQPHKFAINTPYLNGSIEGTEFLLSVSDTNSTLTVLEGKVLASNEYGQVMVKSGEVAHAKSGTAPVVRILLNPRDTVQWALYYPPLMTAFTNTHTAQLPNYIRESITLTQQGEINKAFSILSNVADSRRNKEFYLYRAALFLSVGRKNVANKDIQQILAKYPDSSGALALQSIIALTNNNKEQALNIAQQAVTHAPDSALALIALSYAQQAYFNLSGAQLSLEQAVAAEPDNGLAWARLAAIFSASGDLDRALATANKAAQVSPELSLAQTVKGYAYLSQVKTEQARQAFNTAIQLDQSDPLPRMGLGLAKIRDGETDAGGRDIELAVALDPNRSIYRSYLGKTYYEQKRANKLVDTQYSIAEELDPNDPTAYFYSAIQKQTTNRPVEALYDMEKAIEKNDNRAVYRSKLLLDSDLAARSAAIARVYTDLGFQQRGLVEGWKSVNTDPSDFSGHRFLADTYSALPRHEIARVSELLQSQILQPINTTPIQPRLAESNLPLISSSGPGALSFTEFNPLFNSNGLNFQASGLVGGNSTYAGEGIVSGIYDKTSFSLGYNHFETNGWRDNADQKDDLANAFIQYEISPDTSIQAEYRYRDSASGDTALRFFADNYQPNLREEETTHTARIGFRHAFNESSRLIGNFSYQHSDRSLMDEPDDIFKLFDLQGKDNAYGSELQYLFNSEYVNVVTGAGYFYIDSEDNITTEIAPLNLPFSINDQTSIDTNTNHTNIYLYSYIKPWRNLTLTVGGSGDFFHTNDALVKGKNQFNPKFGISWNPFTNTTIRAAAFRVLKRTLITDQTLEPTQVAGFNQFYDELNTTDYWTYGGAIDQKFGHSVAAGIEYTFRDLQVPFTSFTGPEPELVDVNWDENRIRTYLFWTPHDWFSLSAEWRWEKLDRDQFFNLGVSHLETHYLPLGVNFFHPSGFSASIIGTYINQKGSFNRIEAPPGINEDGEDNFWLMDLGVKYRFPKRYGFLSVGVKNLLNQQFNYYDTDIKNPSIQPDRTVFSSITIAIP